MPGVPKLYRGSFYPMSISSKSARLALAVFSLVPLFASSTASAKTVSSMAVTDSAYTSTSPVASRAWTDMFVNNDVVETAAPEPVPAKPVKIDYVDITAYRAVMAECDSDPLVTADGTAIGAFSDLNIIAANHLPFGTKVRIPEYFGDKVFEVRDRMNARYTHRIDILMTNAKDVDQWGIKRRVKVEIIEMGTNAHHWNDPDMKEARRRVASQS